MTLAPAIIAAAVSLVVSVLTAFLTPAVTSLRVRREAINAKFDAATEALLLVQATRQMATGMQRGLYPGTEEEYRLFILKMAENSITQFVEQTRRARFALVAISNYVPETREWITSGWELTTQEREPEQRKIIEVNREQALKTERLFRQSKRLTVKPESERAIVGSPG